MAVAPKCVLIKIPENGSPHRSRAQHRQQVSRQPEGPSTATREGNERQVASDNDASSIISRSNISWRDKRPEERGGKRGRKTIRESSHLCYGRPLISADGEPGNYHPVSGRASRPLQGEGERETSLTFCPAPSSLVKRGGDRAGRG